MAPLAEGWPMQGFKNLRILLANRSKNFISYEISFRANSFLSGGSAIFIALSLGSDR